MASNEVAERIRKEREAVDIAQNKIAELSGQRTQELEAGNDARVDEIESEIQSAESAIARGEERLTLLERRLTEAKESEEAKELDDLMQQAAQARSIGEKLIKADYAKAAAEVSAVMVKLTAIDTFIGGVNYRLQRAGRTPVNGPNAMRCKPRQLVERKSIEELGISDSRHPLHADSYIDPNGNARNRKTHEPVAAFSEVEVTYTDTIAAYAPDPLQQAVRLPGIDGTPDSLWPTGAQAVDITILKSLGIGEPTSTVRKLKSLIGSKAA